MTYQLIGIIIAVKLRIKVLQMKKKKKKKKKNDKNAAENYYPSSWIIGENIGANRQFTN